MSFESLGIQLWLMQQCKSLGITSPTEVQKQCIPLILQGKNVVGGAVTGSGKTAAFALPILQLLSEDPYGVYALVVTPSRELAYQILDQFVAFGSPIGVRTAVVIGGAPHPKQLDAVHARPHIVVGTPGRLRFLFENYPEFAEAFRCLRFLVLDEADRLVSGDIADDLFECVSLLSKSAKTPRQTLLFTATADSSLTDVAGGVLPRLGVVDQQSLVACCCSSESLTLSNKLYTIAPHLDEKYLFVPNEVKLAYACTVLRAMASETKSWIVFTGSCLRCEIVRLALQLLGFPVVSLDSLLTQQQRLNHLAMFKAGVARILVATDIASRGLDIPTVDVVMHYDIPKLSSLYVHRVGRTARAGKSGLSLALVSQHDVYFVHRIERKTGSRMKRLHSKSVSDEAVLGCLDEVSKAKVQAKLQVRQ